MWPWAGYGFRVLEREIFYKSVKVAYKLSIFVVPTIFHQKIQFHDVIF